ncbi:MAG: methyltransferase domain-containing protein [Candidatus Omnitrophica bacterium]|nr:methyltransferase domain-containing protein [Candidatus Omnitrophota bacterium]
MLRGELLSFPFAVTPALLDLTGVEKNIDVDLKSMSNQERLDWIKKQLEKISFVDQRSFPPGSKQHVYLTVGLDQKSRFANCKKMDVPFRVTGPVFGNESHYPFKPKMESYYELQVRPGVNAGELLEYILEHEQILPLLHHPRFKEEGSTILQTLTMASHILKYEPPGIPANLEEKMPETLRVRLIGKPYLQQFVWLIATQGFFQARKFAKQNERYLNEEIGRLPKKGIQAVGLSRFVKSIFIHENLLNELRWVIRNTGHVYAMNPLDVGFEEVLSESERDYPLTAYGKYQFPYPIEEYQLLVTGEELTAVSKIPAEGASLGQHQIVIPGAAWVPVEMVKNYAGAEQIDRDFKAGFFKWDERGQLWAPVLRDPTYLPSDFIDRRFSFHKRSLYEHLSEEDVAKRIPTRAIKGVGEAYHDVLFSYLPYKRLNTQKFRGGETKDIADYAAGIAKQIRNEYEKALQEKDPVVMLAKEKYGIDSAPTLRPLYLLQPKRIPEKMFRQRGYKLKDTKKELRRGGYIPEEYVQNQVVFVYEVPLMSRVYETRILEKQNIEKFLLSPLLAFSGPSATPEFALKQFAARLAVARHLMERRLHGTFSVDVDFSNNFNLSIPLDQRSIVSSLSSNNVTLTGHVVDLDSATVFMKKRKLPLGRLMDVFSQKWTFALMEAFLGASEWLDPEIGRKVFEEVYQAGEVRPVMTATGASLGADDWKKDHPWTDPDAWKNGENFDPKFEAQDPNAWKGDPETEMQTGAGPKNKEDSPADILFLENKLKQEMKKRDWNSALKTMGKIERQASLLPEHLIIRGSILRLHPNSWPAAERDFTNAVLMAKDLPKNEDTQTLLLTALIQRGSLYLSENRLNSAIGDFSRALDIDPDVSAILQLRGMAYLKVPACGEARQDLERVAFLDGKDTALEVYLGLAYIYHQLGDPASEGRILRRASQYHPRNIKMDYYKALMFYQNDAEDSLRKALLKTTNILKRAEQPVIRKAALLLRAEIYLRLKEENKAEKCFEDILKLDPMNSDVMITQAGILYRLNKKEQSRSHLREALFLRSGEIKNDEFQLFFGARYRSFQYVIKQGLNFLFTGQESRNLEDMLMEVIVSHLSSERVRDLTEKEISKIRKNEDPAKRLIEIDKVMQRAGRTVPLLLVRAETLMQQYFLGTQEDELSNIHLLEAVRKDYLDILELDSDQPIAKRGLKEVERLIENVDRASMEEDEGNFPDDETAAGASLGEEFESYAAGFLKIRQSMRAIKDFIENGEMKKVVEEAWGVSLEDEELENLTISLVHIVQVPLQIVRNQLDIWSREKGGAVFQRNFDGRHKLFKESKEELENFLSSEDQFSSMHQKNPSKRSDTLSGFVKKMFKKRGVEPQHIPAYGSGPFKKAARAIREHILSRIADIEHTTDMLIEKLKANGNSSSKVEGASLGVDSQFSSDDPNGDSAKSDLARTWGYILERTNGGMARKQPRIIEEILARFFSSLRQTSPNARVLDLGTLDGKVLRIAQGILNNKAGLHGIDIAVQDHTEAGTGKSAIHFHHEDMENLEASHDFQPGSFDAVTSVFAVEYSDVAKTLQGVSRFLRPGARAIFVMHHKNSYYVHHARASKQIEEYIFASGVLESIRSFLNRPSAEGRRKMDGSIKPIISEMNRIEDQIKQEKAVPPEVLSLLTRGPAIYRKQIVDKIIRHHELTADFKDLAMRWESISNFRDCFADIFRSIEQLDFPAAVQKLSLLEKDAHFDYERNRCLLEKAAVYGPGDEEKLKSLFHQQDFEVGSLEVVSDDLGIHGWKVEIRKPASVQAASLGRQEEMTKVRELKGASLGAATQLTWQGDKFAQMHFDPAAYQAMSEKDRDALKRTVVGNASSLEQGKDFKRKIGEDPDVYRSLLLNFNRPGVKLQGIQYPAAQVKGVVFNSGRLAEDFDLRAVRKKAGYEAASGPAMKMQFESDGRIAWIPKVVTPRGAMLVEEAQKEFQMHQFFFSGGMPVNYPIAYGTYPKETPDRDRKLGLVVLGQRAPYQARMGEVMDYAIGQFVEPVLKARQQVKGADFQTIVFPKLLEVHQRLNFLSYHFGQLLRKMHDTNLRTGWPGAIHGNFHLGNMSGAPTEGGGLEFTIHDLVDAVSKKGLSKPEIFARQSLDVLSSAESLSEVQTLLNKFLAKWLKENLGMEGIPELNLMPSFIEGYFHDLVQDPSFPLLMQGFSPLEGSDGISQSIWLQMTRIEIAEQRPLYQSDSVFNSFMRHVAGIDQGGKPVQSHGASLGSQTPVSIWIHNIKGKKSTKLTLEPRSVREIFERSVEIDTAMKSCGNNFRFEITCSDGVKMKKSSSDPTWGNIMLQHGDQVHFYPIVKVEPKPVETKVIALVSKGVSAIREPVTEQKVLESAKEKPARETKPAVVKISTLSEQGVNEDALKNGKALLLEIVLKPEQINWEKEKSNLPDLAGLPLGITDQYGGIYYQPESGKQFVWYVPGMKERGWGAIARKGEVKDGVYELTVEFTSRGKSPVTKTFLIGVERKGLNLKGGSIPNSAWSIVDKEKVAYKSKRSGLDLLSDIVTKPRDFNWTKEAATLPNLKDLPLGTTNNVSRLNWHPVPSYQFHWNINGLGGGWQARVKDTGIRAGLYELVVELTKVGEEPVERTFHIGVHRVILTGKKNQARKKLEVWNITDGVGLELLSKIIMKPADIDWEKEAKSLPDLTGFPLGETDAQGQINFMPFANFQFTWRFSGFKESGWKVRVREAGVRNGLYQLTVELSKKGREPQLKTYLVGLERRNAKGTQYETGNKREVWNLVDQDVVKVRESKSGLKVLSEIIKKPADFDWEKEAANLPKLNGLPLGITDDGGKIYLSPFKYFRFDWPVLGTRGAGWKAYVKDTGIRNGLFMMTVALEKDGEQPIEKQFYIGVVRKKLRGTLKEEGDRKEIWDIVDEVPFRVISHLMSKSRHANWEKEAKGVPSLKGFTLGNVNQFGQIIFPVVRNCLYRWNILGSIDSGWEATVVDSGFLENGRFQVTVELTKEGRDPIRKKFLIGVTRKKLKGYKVVKGEKIDAWGEVWNLVDSQVAGLRLLEEIVSLPADFNWLKEGSKLPNLNGLELGNIDSGGRVSVYSQENYQYLWNILGFHEEGWKASIKKTELVNGLLELTVSLTKDERNTIERKFYLGFGRRSVTGRLGETGKKIEVWEIVNRIGPRILSEIITRPYDGNWTKEVSRFPSLSGFQLGVTDQKGHIIFTPITNYSFIWSILGYREKGWSAIVVESGVVDGNYQFVVELRKEGKQSLRRIFRIGPQVRKLKIQSKIEGSEKNVLNIINVKSLLSLATVSVESREGERTALWVKRTEGYDVTSDYENPWKSAAAKELVEKLGAVMETLKGQSIDIAARLVSGEEEQDLVQEGEYSADEVQKVKIKLQEGLREYGNEQQIGSGASLGRLTREEEETRRLLSILLTKPKDYSWKEFEQTLPQLAGRPLGAIDAHGLIWFSPRIGFLFPWPVLGSSEKGWHGVITSSGVVNGYYRFTVKLSKAGKSIERIFQVGPYSRILRGRNGKSYSSQEILDLLDVNNDLGLAMIADLVSQPANVDWKKVTRRLHDLEGMPLGEVPTTGVISLPIDANFRYRWKVGNREHSSRKAQFETWWIENGHVRFSILLRENDQAFRREYQIGPERRLLSSEGATVTGKVPEIFQMKLINTVKLPSSRGASLGSSPLEFLGKNHDLRKFAEKYLSRRYRLWGLDASLAGNILDVLVTHQNDPDMARQKVYENVIRFETDKRWKAAYDRYQEATKYTAGYFQIKPYLKNLPTGAVLVDVGAGNNALGKVIARNQAGLTVIGTDIYDYHEEHGLPNLRFVQQRQADRLSFEDHFVDVVVLNAMLHHVSGDLLEPLLNEIRRVLKPGGRVLLIEDTYSETVSPDPASDAELTSEFLGLVRKTGSEFAKNFFTFNDWYANILVHQWTGMAIPYNFHSMEEWQEIFKKSGFSSAQARYLGFPKQGFHKPSLAIQVFSAVPLAVASAGASLGRVRGKNQDAEIQETKLLLSELVTKPANFDWKANAKKIPQLKGHRLGVSNKGGTIPFSPGINYLYSWSIVGSDEGGWDAVITDSGIFGNVFRFSVLLKKPGKKPIQREFQIGPETRILKLDSRVRKSTMEVLRIIPLSEIARDGLSEILTKPVDFNWAANANRLPDLSGLPLGVTNTLGQIGIYPVRNYIFGWPILGSAKEGWEAFVIKSEVNGNYYQLTVRLTKSGEESIEKVFQIGHYTRTVRGINENSGKLMEVLDVDDQLGLRALSELVTKPRNSKWDSKAGNLPDIRGLRLGITNKSGRVSFSPVQNYGYDWAVLGTEDGGWQAVIKDSSINNGYYQFTVELTKKGEKPLYRTFQIGRFTRTLKRSPVRTKDNTVHILDMDDRLGLRALSELIMKPKNFDWKSNEADLPQLKGLQLGATNIGGRISFAPLKNYIFNWTALGFHESGWNAVITDYEYHKNYVQFTVELTKQRRNPVYRTFQISSVTTNIVGVNEDKGRVKEVLEIDDRLGLQQLSKLIIQPEDYNWKANVGSLPDLTGLQLGETNVQGHISFSPATNRSFSWPVFGSRSNGKGWKAVVLKSGVKGKYFQFIVELTQNGSSPIQRTFQIGPYTKFLRNSVTGRKSDLRVLNFIDLKTVMSLATEGVVKTRTREWDMRTEKQIPVAATEQPLQQVITREILESLEKIISSMNEKEGEIASRIVGGEEDEDLVSGDEFTQDEVRKVRENLQKELKVFVGNGRFSGSSLGQSDRRGPFEEKVSHRLTEIQTAYDALTRLMQDGADFDQVLARNFPGASPNEKVMRWAVKRIFSHYVSTAAMISGLIKLQEAQPSGSFTRIVASPLRRQLDVLKGVLEDWTRFKAEEEVHNYAIAINFALEEAPGLDRAQFEQYFWDHSKKIAAEIKDVLYPRVLSIETNIQELVAKGASLGVDRADYSDRADEAIIPVAVEVTNKIFAKEDAALLGDVLDVMLGIGVARADVSPPQMIAPGITVDELSRRLISRVIPSVLPDSPVAVVVTESELASGKENVNALIDSLRDGDLVVEIDNPATADNLLALLRSRARGKKIIVKSLATTSPLAAELEAKLKGYESRFSLEEIQDLISVPSTKKEMIHFSINQKLLFEHHIAPQVVDSLLRRLAQVKDLRTRGLIFQQAGLERIDDAHWLVGERLVKLIEKLQTELAGHKIMAQAA